MDKNIEKLVEHQSINSEIDEPDINEIELSTKNKELDIVSNNIVKIEMEKIPHRKSLSQRSRPYSNAIENNGNIDVKVAKIKQEFN